MLSFKWKFGHILNLNSNILCEFWQKKRNWLSIEYSFGGCKSGTTFWICTKLSSIVCHYQRRLFSLWDLRQVVMAFNDVAKTVFTKKIHKHPKFARFRGHPLLPNWLKQYQIWHGTSWYVWLCNYEVENFPITSALKLRGQRVK